jgi:thymidine kinase
MNNELTFDGKLKLILGPMWASKSSELIRNYNRYIIGGQKCMMIKYAKDTRYDDKAVTTHDGVKVAAHPCTYLYEVDHLVKNYDVICIDEIQFYKDAFVFCDKWCNMGLIVIACGLNGTFNRTPFPVISRLIPLAESITFVTAVCKENGDEAVYSNINIKVENGTTEVIGGSELYNAVDRKTYYKNKQFYTPELIREFAEIYISANNLIVSPKIIDDFVKNFNGSEMDFVKSLETYTTLV